MKRKPHEGTRRLNLAAVTSALAGLAIAPSLAAQLIISFGDWQLQPNAISDPIPLVLQNQGAAVDVIGGLVNLQVADGGPEAGGLIDGPAISEIDILGAGALFGAQNTGAGGLGSLVPQIFERGTTTPQNQFVTIGRD